MKRLYENIEEINIQGGIHRLSEVVTAMDIALQNIAENTEQLTEYLAKYSSSNKGKQYEKVVNTSMNLRDILFRASTELNDMQNQIVEYQNKIYRYEDMSDYAQKPNAYLVSVNRNVNVDTSMMQFSREEMISVASVLRNYMDKVIHHIKDINEKKNEIASVWRDAQYNDFADFIETVERYIIEGIKAFEEYVIYLEDKIRELS